MRFQMLVQTMVFARLDRGQERPGGSWKKLNIIHEETIKITEDLRFARAFELHCLWIIGWGENPGVNA